MTKNTPRIFISLLLILLCIGILPVSAFASGGDYPDDALPTAESSAADAQETKQISAREKGEKVLSHCFTYHIPLKDTPPLPIPPLSGENNANNEEELR